MLTFYGTSYFYDMLKLGGGETLGDISQGLWIMLLVWRETLGPTQMLHTPVWFPASTLVPS